MVLRNDPAIRGDQALGLDMTHRTVAGVGNL